MESKSCTRCFEIKQRSSFSEHSGAADGLQSQCKACFAERGRLRRQGKPCISCGQPKEVGVPRGARLCMKCADVCYACGKNPRREQHRMCAPCMAEQDKARKSSPEARLKIRISKIASKYKVRKALAAVMAVYPVCEACGKKGERAGEMHVDHCHDTGAVRGVLCFNCNAALGHVNDSIERLQSLIRYLNQKTEQNKNGLEDLLKAKHYIDLLIELEGLDRPIPPAGTPVEWSGDRQPSQAVGADVAFPSERHLYFAEVASHE